MIRTETDRDLHALRDALLILEQIAKRSTDKSSRALAEGAAGDLRACIEANALRACTEEREMRRALKGS
jgi:hypothetical protein